MSEAKSWFSSRISFFKPESDTAAFLARFGSGLGPGSELGLGLGLGVGLGLRPCLDPGTSRKFFLALTILKQ